MEKARRIIKDALAAAEHPAVLCSFGKDSMLLLRLVHELRPDVPVIWFRSGLTSKQQRFAKRMIVELDLHVWSWQPSDVYVLPNGEGFSLIREQAFGLHRLPNVLDIEDGGVCIADVITQRTPELFPHFDCLFIGYKDSDSHEVLGGSGFCPEDGWELARAKTYAPLRHLSDARVWEAIKGLGVSFDEERYLHGGQDPDTIQACTRCLHGQSAFCPKEGKVIAPVEWDAQASLTAFKQRFGFKEAA
jgi:hypothetical protein